MEGYFLIKEYFGITEVLKYAEECEWDHGDNKIIVHLKPALRKTMDIKAAFYLTAKNLELKVEPTLLSAVSGERSSWDHTVFLETCELVELEQISNCSLHFPNYSEKPVLRVSQTDFLKELDKNLYKILSKNR